MNAGGLLKVVRFHEETVYEPEVIEAIAPETGWKWGHRYAWICGAAVLLGVILWGTLLILWLAPIYQKTGAWWPLIVSGLGIAALTFYFQFWLGRYFLLNGLSQLVERVLSAVPDRIALPKESLRKVSGLEGAQLAQAFNSLMTLARAENGAAPLSAYRESFLAGAQPSYICDFRTGRFLDCNHAFADFIGMGREALLLQRLGDVTVGSQKSKTEDTGPIPAMAVENSPATEIRFRHSSGAALAAVTFLRPVPVPNKPGRVVHCAVVVPQIDLETEKS